MFAELTSNRMSRRVCSGLRPELMLRVAPAHANDNHVTRHGPDATTKRPVLTCRWIPSAAGGLECRWVLADGDVARQDETADAVRVRGPVVTGGRRLAFVAISVVGGVTLTQHQRQYGVSAYL